MEFGIMKTEKTQAGSQLYFGKIEALQPKKIKADKGSEGCPLFDQQPEADKNQLQIFEAEAMKQTATIYRINKSLEPEKVGSIKGSTAEELTNEFLNFMNIYTKGKGYLTVKDSTSIIGIFAKRKDYNYYLTENENNES